jgi:hypothetical protein
MTRGQIAAVIVAVIIGAVIIGAMLVGLANYWYNAGLHH